MTKSEFLSKLADEARGNLSPEVTQALVCEVAGHLDESIQSRLELGEPPEVAEINAIAAFATPASFVHGMETVHETTRSHDRVLLALGSVCVFSLAFWMCFTGLTHEVYGAWMCLVFGSLACVLLRSCFLKTPRWGTLKTLTIASIVLIGGVQPLLQVNLWEYGGIGYVPTRSIQSYISAERAELEHPTHGWGLDAGQIEMNIQAAEQAASAPLWGRWRRSFGPSGGLMIFSIAMLVIAHLLPIAVRRRWRRSRLGRA